MAGVIEFIIKMQDGLSGPLAKVTYNSTNAKNALSRLTESNKELKSMVGESGMSIHDLEEKIDKLKEYRDILPSSAYKNIKSINEEIERLNEEIGKLQGGHGGSLKSWFHESFTEIPKILRNPITIIGAGLAASLNTGMKQSKESLDFRLLLGEKSGEKLYEGIKKFQPVLGDSVQQISKDLLHAGVSSGNLEKMLGQLGAASMGDESRFGALSSAFIQLNRDGKLTETTLAAMNNAGFKPLTHISETFGIKLSKVQQMLADGKIDIDLVNKALEDATSKGGEFAGIMDQLNGEPSAVWGRMMEKVEGLAGRLGKVLLPALNVAEAGFDYLGTGMDYIAGLFEDLFNWGDENKTLLETLTGVVIGAAAGYEAFQIYQKLSYMWMMRGVIADTLAAGARGVLATVTGGLTAAQTALNAAFFASPVGWIVAGMGLIVGGIVYAWNKFEGFRKVVYGVWESIKSIFSNIGKFFGKLFGMDTGEYEDVGKAWGRGVAKGADSWQQSQKKKTAEEEHFGTDTAGLEKILGIKLPTTPTNNNMQSGVDAVSGGGAKNITITIGKMIEKMEIRVVGGTQQVAHELQQAIEEVMVRAIASASAR